MLIKSKLLIVDENESTRIFMRYILVNGGYRTTAVASPDLALQLLLDETFDAVIIEMKLPELSGIELVRKLRQQADMEDKPIIAVSLCNTETVIQEALDAGVTEWLVRPVAPPFILQLVKELCPPPIDEDVMKYI